ncbi:MAG TPA: penicillin-binding transpeptidase domain-containing protein, partial [Desulfuromonadales bacterium]|nr:penicillin-binding transpeptidase domain-containing protein [Desulfuromonadales bacterium]
MRKRSGSAWDRLAYSNWRDFQKELRRRETHKGSRRLWLAVTAVLMLAGICGLYPLLRRPQAPSAIASPGPATRPETKDRRLDKAEVRNLLDTKDVNDLTTKNVALKVGRHELQVETSLDVGLQKYLLERLDRKDSHAIGIVVMDPGTGRVLAMVGFDRASPTVNPCLRSSFPSASVFKIVTTAAAVEHCGFRASSPVHF